jgi:hypothetical protein
MSEDHRQRILAIEILSRWGAPGTRAERRRSPHSGECRDPELMDGFALEQSTPPRRVVESHPPGAAAFPVLQNHLAEIRNVTSCASVQAFIPPSTVIFAPVMYEASGPATNATVSAISSTRP